MSVAVSQVGTATTGGDPSSGSFSITKPTGVQSGDVLLVFGASNKGAWDTLPSGFTQIDVSTDATFTNNYRAYAWYKVCGGSEPSSYSFGSTTAAGSGAPMVAHMTAWRGVLNSSPIMHNARTDAASNVGEPYTPGASFTQSATGRVVFARTLRVQTSSGVNGVSTFSSATGGWSELADSGQFSGGTVSYSIGTYGKTADTSSGSQTCPATTATQAESDNVSFLIALRGEMDADNAPTAAVTANDATTAATANAQSAAATVTAFDAAGVAGVQTTAQGVTATATAFDAQGWIIFPASAGATAYDASVSIGVSSGYAAASVTVGSSVGYFGAPASRRWRIAAEDRTWRIPAEDRTWRIPSEDS